PLGFQLRQLGADCGEPLFLALASRFGGRELLLFGCPRTLGFLAPPLGVVELFLDLRDVGFGLLGISARRLALRVELHGLGLGRLAAVSGLPPRRERVLLRRLALLDRRPGRRELGPQPARFGLGALLRRLAPLGLVGRRRDLLLLALALPHGF